MASDKPVCGHCHIHIPRVKREKKTMNKTKIPPSLPPAKTLSTISRNHISSLKRKRVKMWSENLCMDQSYAFKCTKQLWVNNALMTGLHYTGAALKESAWRSRNRGTGYICVRTERERQRHLNTRLSPSLISNQSGDRLKDTQITWSSHSACDR